MFEKFATVGYSITAELQKDREEMLRKYLDRGRGMGLKSVDIKEEEGSSAANEILEIAKRENVDTIVVVVEDSILLHHIRHEIQRNR